MCCSFGGMCYRMFRRLAVTLLTVNFPQTPWHRWNVCDIIRIYTPFSTDVIKLFDKLQTQISMNKQLLSYEFISYLNTPLIPIHYHRMIGMYICMYVCMYACIHR